MVNTSRKFLASKVEEIGGLLFKHDNVPDKMPVLKGSYAIIAILSGTNWRFGQFVHNPSFYTELLQQAKTTGGFFVEALYSVHTISLQGIPQDQAVPVLKLQPQQ